MKVIYQSIWLHDRNIYLNNNNQIKHSYNNLKLWKKNFKVHILINGKYFVCKVCKKY
jgi:hypothetical protein